MHVSKVKNPMGGAVFRPGGCMFCLPPVRRSAMNFEHSAIVLIVKFKPKLLQIVSLMSKI